MPPATSADVLAVAADVTGLLEEAGVPYAIGCALALAHQGVVSVPDLLEKLRKLLFFRTIAELMVEDDERTRAWDDLVRDFGGHRP